MVRIILLALALPLALSATDLQSYLKQYEGRWVGDYSVTSTANAHTEKFLVEQRYWFKGKVLYGVAVYERDGKLVTASSKTWVDGKKLVSEIKRGEVVEVYYGVLHDGGLLWLSSNMQRANDYQMRETLIEKEGQPMSMKVEGFDTYISEDGLVYLIYKGDLTLQSEEGDKE